MTGPTTTNVLLVHAEDSLPNSAIANANKRYRFSRVSVASRSVPRAVPDDHVRVRMLYAGVCGTDVHLVLVNRETGFVLTSAPASIPAEGRVLGHEGVGRVIEIGKSVRDLLPGDIVAFASILACMHCDSCRKGNFNQCRHSQLLGVQVDGIFASIVDLPVALAHNVSDMIGGDDDLRAVACIEPAGVALQACERAQVGPGDSVVIFGAGPIGIYAAMLCKRAFGAARVDVVEPVAFRRNLARNWSDNVYDPDEYFSSETAAADVVLECSGVLGNVERVFDRIAPNGRVILLGRSGEPLTISATDHMITEGISVAGCRGHLGGALGRVISLYRAGMLPLDAIVTGEVTSLEDLSRALAEPEKILASHCKLLIRFDRD